MLHPTHQLAILAGVTCLERRGRVNRTEADLLLSRQGDRAGWSAGWQNAISADAVEQLIDQARGCRSLLRALRRSGIDPRSGAVPPPEQPAPGARR